MHKRGKRGEWALQAGGEANQGDRERQHQEMLQDVAMNRHIRNHCKNYDLEHSISGTHCTNVTNFLDGEGPPV